MHLTVHHIRVHYSDLLLFLLTLQEENVMQQYRITNAQLQGLLTTHNNNLDAVLDTLDKEIIETLLKNTCAPDSLDLIAATGDGDVRPRMNMGGGDERQLSVGTSAFAEDDVIARQLKDENVPYEVSTCKCRLP